MKENLRRPTSSALYWGIKKYSSDLTQRNRACMHDKKSFLLCSLGPFRCVKYSTYYFLDLIWSTRPLRWFALDPRAKTDPRVDWNRNLMGLFRLKLGSTMVPREASNPTLAYKAELTLWGGKRLATTTFFYISLN